MTSVDNILINNITNELVLLHCYPLSICLYFGLLLQLLLQINRFVTVICYKSKILYNITISK